MFFVLSGFLITSLLLGEWARRLTIRLGSVLDTAGAAAAAGPPPAAHRRGRLRPLLRLAGRVRLAPPRLAVDAVLRGQLALHRGWLELLRPVGPALAAVPHVVAGDRGAVLHRVATGGTRPPPPRPATAAVPPAVAGARRRRGRRAGLGGRHALVLPPPRKRDPPVRGDRHPLPGHPGRGGAGHRHGHVGAAPAGTAAAGSRPGRAGAGPDPPVCRHRRPGSARRPRRRDVQRRRGPSGRAHHRVGTVEHQRPGWPPRCSAGPRSLGLVVLWGRLDGPTGFLFAGGELAVAVAVAVVIFARGHRPVGQPVPGARQPGVRLRRQDLVRASTCGTSPSSPW